MKEIRQPMYDERRKRGKCVIAHCKNNSHRKDRFCCKHRREYQKLNNPLRYWFDVLRQNAKRRKKDFTLTIEEFKIFCDNTGYLELKGKNAGGYTIDRRKDSIGYTFENIFVLTNSQNSRKRFIDLKLKFGYYPTDEELEALYGGKNYFEEHIKPDYDTQEQKEQDPEEVPF